MTTRWHWAVTCLAAIGAGTALAGSVAIDGETLTAETSSVRVVFSGASISSVTPAGRDVEFIHPTPAAHGIDLFYLNGNTLGDDKHQSTRIERLSPSAARIVVDGGDSLRSLLVAVDEGTGDVRITPEGMSARRGVRSVGWRVPVHPEATVILPVVNGMEIGSDRPFPPSGRFPWPFKWEAQLAVAQRDDATMMIHAEERAKQFKALRLDRNGTRTELCFESEPPGPLWQNRAAGCVEWRLNAYAGDWKVPAARYRSWMARAYELEAKRAHRPSWVSGISLAVCWARVSEPMLDALAAVHPPGETLIHLSHHWRGSKYDVDYPDYTPNEAALAYMAKARSMGFHVMPHFNFWAVDEDHPFTRQLDPFQIRSVDQNRPEGWYWPPETHDYTRMLYIHPGLGLWRSKLIEVVLDTCGTMKTDAAFIDQTLCTWNTDNGLIQGLNTIEGMQLAQEQFAAVRPELVLVGEGLNEMSFQRECFAQAHIHDGWGELEPKHVDAAHPICAFLWEGHTRLIGYYHLRPTEKGYDLGAEVYERMNALPTLITNNPKDLTEMNDTTRRILDRARALSANH